MTWLWSLLPLTLLFTWRVDAANVLVIPIPLKSQMILGAQAAKALVQGGHTVWLVGAYKDEEKYKKLGVTFLGVNVAGLERFEKILSGAARAAAGGSNQMSVRDKLGLVVSINSITCPDIFTDTVFMEKISKVKFDLAVMGTTLALSCMYLIPYKYDIPYITYMPIDYPMAVPLPSVQPMPLVSPPVTNAMTFYERLCNTFAYVGFTAVRYFSHCDTQARFAPEKPTKRFSELVDESQMTLIVYDNLCFEYPRVMAPNYRFIGALTNAEAEPLTGELGEFADGAKDGLIFVTFGTVDVGREFLKASMPVLREVAPHLKQKILLQYAGSTDDLGCLPANMKHVTWTPQPNVLAHPNTRLMIGHGGMNGQMETVYHRVPQLCLGLQEEQRYNCHRLQTHGYGLALPITNLTAITLRVAINEILNTPSYKERVTWCADMLRSVPSAAEQLRFWVDHVIKFGAAHLQPPKLPLYSYFMLDILAFLITMVILVLCLSYFIIRCTCRRICGRCRKTKQE